MAKAVNQKKTEKVNFLIDSEKQKKYI